MKNKVLPIVAFAITAFLNPFLVKGQTKPNLNNIQVYLQNKSTNETKAFLYSDTIPDDTKLDYVKLSSGLNFFKFNALPRSLQVFADPAVYGLSAEQSEYIRYIVDSNTASNILIYKIENFDLFKAEISKDKLANFEVKDGVIELYKNTTFIKGNRLVFISSEEITRKKYYYDDDDYKPRYNAVEVVKSSYNIYCTESEYKDHLSFAPHLRIDPDYPDNPSPTIEQVKESKKYGGDEFYEDTYDYAYATEVTSGIAEEDSFEKLYAIDEEDAYQEAIDNRKNPLSYYKGVERKNNYNLETAADKIYNNTDYAEATYDTASADYAEAVVYDSAYPYDYYDEANEEYDYETATLFSKKDQRKLDKLEKKKAKILAKSGLNESEEEYDYEQEYAEEAYEYQQYYSIPYYKLVPLFENKEIAAPFLESNFKITSTQKSFVDFKNSKAASSVWVNQESLSQLVFSEFIKEFRLDDKITASNVDYLKDCAILFEMDYSLKANTASFKGYGNAKYLSDIKSIFNTKTPANWLANVPANAPVLASIALDNSKLLGYYKQIIKSVFANSTYDTVSKEVFNLLEVVIDEEALSKAINGKTLVYLNGKTNKYTKYYSSYDYDENYEYKTKYEEKEEEEPSFAHFLGFDDKSMIQSYVNLVQYFGYLKFKDGIYTVCSRSTKHENFDEKKNSEHFYLAFISNALVTSNDLDLLKSIVNNKKANNPQLASVLDKNNLYFKMDFSSLVTTLQNTQYGKNESLVKYLSQFEKIELNGLEFDENKFMIKVNVEQKNAKDNKIYSLFNLFNF